MPTPRPSLHSRALAAAWLLAACPLTASAQALPPPPPATAAGFTKEEPLVLSPFEVGSDSERGYQSTAILQGGLVARLLDFGAAQGEFQIGHARYEGRGQAAIVSCAFRTRGDERRDGARRRARGALKGLDAARIMVACPGSC